MNILPLICGLLFVFSCLAYTFVKDAKSLSIAEWSLSGAARGEKGVNNRLEARKFRNASSQESKPPPPPQETKKPHSPRYLRWSVPMMDSSKLSLTPLFEEMADPSSHPLFPVAARLLQLLYENTSLIPAHMKKGWETELLLAIIAVEKTLSHYEDLADLFPKDPHLSKLYYQMLKGTNQFSLETHQGIPPFGEFFTLREEPKQAALYFHFAPPILLTALFGDKLAKEILSEEKAEWHLTHQFVLFDKAELQALMMKHSTAGFSLSSLEPYLNFSTQIPPKHRLAATDSETGMRITRACKPKSKK